MPPIVVAALAIGGGLTDPVRGDLRPGFGGTKQSGVGREGGHEGMLDYLESKYVAVAW